MRLHPPSASSNALLSRRDCLSLLAAAPGVLGLLGGCGLAPARSDRPSAARLLFTSQGKTGIVGADGAGLRYLELNVAGQATWQPGPELPEEVVVGTRARYLEAFERITGIPFDEYATRPQAVLE